LCLNLFDAAAGADRLIVQAGPGLFLIGVRPLGVDRIRKGRPRAGDVERARRRDEGGRREGRRRDGVDEFHEVSPSCPSERNAAWADPQTLRSLGGFKRLVSPQPGRGFSSFCRTAGTVRRLMSSFYDVSATPL